MWLTAQSLRVARGSYDLAEEFVEGPREGG